MLRVIVAKTLRTDLANLAEVMGVIVVKTLETYIVNMEEVTDVIDDKVPGIGTADNILGINAPLAKIPTGGTPGITWILAPARCKCISWYGSEMSR